MSRLETLPCTHNSRLYFGAKDGLDRSRERGLLEKGEASFDVFLTGDRNLTFQQDLHRFRIAVIVLHAPGTQLRDTQPLMPKVVELLSTIPSGEVTDVYP
ncbi:MAG: hypothetical protein QOF62_2042 [Pyrinomonadaceae bacterium]|nr:hypothetical protein [Pyrinomonadaceae bacterium]